MRPRDFQLLLPLIAAVTVFAQTPGLPDLKTVLELSDAQIQSLGQLEQQKGQAVQRIAQRMQQSQQPQPLLPPTPWNATKREINDSTWPVLPPS